MLCHCLPSRQAWCHELCNSTRISGSGSALWCCSHTGVGAGWVGPGQITLRVGTVVIRVHHGISSETCACGTAPPGAPGTAWSRSAGGRGVLAGLWRWPAPLGLGSTYGPGSPSTPGRPTQSVKSKLIQQTCWNREKVCISPCMYSFIF